jgi:hypothetical protein
MVRKNLLRAVARRVKGGAQAMEFRLGGAIDLGVLEIAGQEITDLAPLGHQSTPGVTKAGRLSLTGLYLGRKVKIYSAHSARQILLRRALGNLDFGECRFPKVIVADDGLVVEEWISGLPVAASGRNVASRAEEAMDRFIWDLQSRPEIRQLAREYADSFDYLNDYLIVRLGPWSRLSPIQTFLERWHGLRARAEAELPARVSHPDLSRANVLHEQGSGKFVVVDNELLGVGQGWVLDRMNSLVARKDNGPELEAFTAMTWGLRRIGSALDASDLAMAMAIARHDAAAV